jgi:fatty acid desaturase
LRHLRASAAAGLCFTFLACALTALGIGLASRGGPIAWIAGQLLLGLGLVEWFVLLHECGHNTLFTRTAANRLVGHAAGFFALIPFGMWAHVHRQHHRWTGWQDLDPTTATLAPRERARLTCRVVRVCWRSWIPLFSVAYRLGNFWSVARIARWYGTGEISTRVVAGLIVSGALYAALVWQVGWMELGRVAGVAVVLAFVVEDMLLISQHTHVPMELSGGSRVAPHRALDQQRFTRSLRFPAPLSRLILHFDAHELHHMYPFVPGYRLREIGYEPSNEVGWWHWVRAARAIPGDVLLFQNRHQTGFDL